ncbi:MAG: hypothetical protein J7480_03325 [Microbacteriaceae bacterium]|nr:hypothetical protein [Microbacteriaceae bacterium]
MGVRVGEPGSRIGGAGAERAAERPGGRAAGGTRHRGTRRGRGRRRRRRGDRAALRDAAVRGAGAGLRLGAADAVRRRGRRPSPALHPRADERHDDPLRAQHRRLPPARRARRGRPRRLQRGVRLDGAGRHDPLDAPGRRRKSSRRLARVGREAVLVKRIDDAAGREALRLAQRFLSERSETKGAQGADDTGSLSERGESKGDRETIATAVRWTLQLLGDQAPGKTLEVRVPPYGAVQAVEGPRHTRGTPPNVIETDAATWLALAGGVLSWADAVDAGRVAASGSRADLTAYLPLI